MSQTGLIKGRAVAQSGFATRRLQNMKAMARVLPPTAATGGFPYPHKSIAETMPHTTRRGRPERPPVVRRPDPPKPQFARFRSTAKEYGFSG